MMINGKETTFIAEVKTASPFGWRSGKSWDELFELANQHGDIISIHTDQRWQGSFELLAEARKIWPGWLSQASNIKTMADINKTTDAILVGSSLETFIKTALPESFKK